MVWPSSDRQHSYTEALEWKHLHIQSKNVSDGYNNTAQVNVAASNMCVNYCQYMNSCLISICGTRAFSEKRCVYTFSNSYFPHGACSCWKSCCAQACLPPKSRIIWLVQVHRASVWYAPLAQYSLKRLTSTPRITSSCQTHTKKTGDSDEKNTMTQCGNLKT